MTWHYCGTEAAGSINLEFISYWKAGVLTHTDNSLTKEERAAIHEQLAKKCRADLVTGAAA
uniref:Uncharacterized protein n=1 Tax=Klebsiella pneumoniae TaxID=573 RepID=A0A8B0SY16_KLEPN|nr:hypothetical protein [Klebsiella pneumoniae]